MQIGLNQVLRYMYFASCAARIAAGTAGPPAGIWSKMMLRSPNSFFRESRSLMRSGMAKSSVMIKSVRFSSFIVCLRRFGLNVV